MELSLDQLSKYIGVEPGTTKRWIHQGKLPVSFYRNLCRFDKAALERWGTRNNIKVNLSSHTQESKSAEMPVTLSDAVLTGGVYHHIDGTDVPGVLKACVDRISQVPAAFKPELLERLVERENAFSTGIGNGIAIPHPREQQTYLDAPQVCVCFLTTPIDYHALDNQPVSVLFLLLCPDLKMHLHLLSAVSFCHKNSEFQTLLKTGPSCEKLVEAIQVLQAQNQF